MYRKWFLAELGWGKISLIRWAFPPIEGKWWKSRNFENFWKNCPWAKIFKIWPCGTRKHPLKSFWTRGYVQKVIFGGAWLGENFTHPPPCQVWWRSKWLKSQYLAKKFGFASSFNDLSSEVRTPKIYLQRAEMFLVTMRNFWVPLGTMWYPKNNTLATLGNTRFQHLIYTSKRSFWVIFFSKNRNVAETKFFI